MSRRAMEVGAMSAPYIQSDDVESGTLKVHILIVSDVRLYRDALASRLAENDRFAIVGAVGRYAAVREVNRYEPDLVLLDVGEWHGLDLATTLLAKRPKLGIVAIAVPEISGSAIAAMLGGIAGFVPRDGSLEDVVSELDRVAAVGRSEPITVVAPPLLQPNAVEPIFAPRSRVGELTPRSRDDRTWPFQQGDCAQAAHRGGNGQESCPQHPRQDECAPSQSGCASRARPRLGAGRRTIKHEEL